VTSKPRRAKTAVKTAVKAGPRPAARQVERPSARSDAKLAPDVVEDRLLSGTLTIRQLKRGHKAGTDAVLLASAVPVLDGLRIVDLGAGVGTVGLIIAARFPRARVTLVDKNSRLVDLAEDNIALNGFQRRVATIEADVFTSAARRRGRGLLPGSFDCVVTNPPWLDGRRFRASPDKEKSTAHVLEGGTLDDWLKTAADLLVPRGDLMIIYRADGLPLLLAAMSGRFGGIVLRPVQPREGRLATRIIIHAVKGSRAPLVIEPPLVLHEADDRFTPEAEAIHRDAGGVYTEDG
jgi:tRNA1(Val) A37 N6-methylase TrmN6